MTFNKKILYVFILMSALFFSLTLYLTCFLIFKGATLANDDANPRTMQREAKIRRGDIYDRDGERLAYSEMTEKGQIRKYPFGRLYSHVIGYNSPTYGRAMLESSYNGYILGTDFTSALFNAKEQLTGGTGAGMDVTLTISHSLQKKAYELLGSRKGAVIAIEPATGAILAMVSKPDFEPDQASLAENWERINSSPDSVLLPRATSGLYAPGSALKPIIAAAAVENNLDGQIFEDKGSVTIDGHEFKNYNGRVYGRIDIKKALAVSSNAAFVELADKLGESRVRSAVESFMIGREIPFDLHVEKSRVLTGNINRTAVAAVGMGQGDTLVTPLNMALVAAGIANDGVIMKPYLVQSAGVKNGVTPYRQRNDRLNQAITSYAADKVTDMMKECVKNGTGTGAAISGVAVAGKTGTAENAGEDHAWFIGFAPAENPKIAVAIIVENAGRTGGELCAPMARELIKLWLGKTPA